MTRGMGLHSLPRSGPGRRGCNRLRLGVSAQLQLTHELRTCMIGDISTTGARLRTSHPLAPRQSAVLLFHELKLFCTVMWGKGAECGVRFDQPLAHEDMQGMLWITENRAHYAQICDEAHALVWAEGTGELSSSNGTAAKAAARAVNFTDS